MNPYSYINRAIHCARTNGIKEVFAIPARMLVTPLVKRLRDGRRFTFDGQPLRYLNHRYNATWSNERCVEVPIGRMFLEDNEILGGSALEVGNVMSHYRTARHTVLDKFETAAGVINQDILDYHPGRKFNLILSISTFEHIGFDDDVKDPTGERIHLAITHCRRLLTNDGRLILTASAGYNPAFDRLMLDLYAKNAGRFSFMRRTSYLNWEQCAVGHYSHAWYNRPHPFGNAIVVAEFGPL